MFDVSDEIIFKTARSGGKGGQNVNKVETAVEGYFPVESSQILTDWQKKLIVEKLQNKITKEGNLFVRSQKERSQLQNKKDVINKINILVNNAIVRKKPRIATKPSKASKMKRLRLKKMRSEKKEARKKPPFFNIHSV